MAAFSCSLKDQELITCTSWTCLYDDEDVPNTLAFNTKLDFTNKSPGWFEACHPEWDQWWLCACRSSQLSHWSLSWEHCLQLARLTLDQVVCQYLSCRRKTKCWLYKRYQRNVFLFSILKSIRQFLTPSPLAYGLYACKNNKKIVTHT